MMCTLCKINATYTGTFNNFTVQNISKYHLLNNIFVQISEQWSLKLLDLIHYGGGLIHFIHILQRFVSILQSFRYYEKKFEHFFGMLLNHKRPVKKQGETV